MAKYIDREAVLHAILGEPTESHYPDWYADKIKALPSADVVPVRRGFWIIGGIVPAQNVIGNWKCSLCRGTSLRDSDYCPNCGAKMDGDADNG